MIHALTPFAIRGAIWYQGESNRNDGLLYEKKMDALIQGWRLAWKLGDFPFYYVQLAPYDYGYDQREAHGRHPRLPAPGLSSGRPRRTPCASPTPAWP